MHLIYKSLSTFTDEQQFNYDSEIFIFKLKKVLQDNIHNNADVISSVVSGGYFGEQSNAY
ncbi:hypothetical protein Awo_c04710 [Acetobacterium woodii DSM 1030]|uniref:Uncharacterized protein n=1 Tax=Acetobacterium woodii (strain ATCC 29683 / DSM 1030 / JCM 2381 / KCTC 1655 / WB1) TaxID=931626 RepID=H6LI96_ACEWD|nr:hypothetical protein Awo_c04710 [Acetobacterium woodii DSM 1030]